MELRIAIGIAAVLFAIALVLFAVVTRRIGSLQRKLDESSARDEKLAAMLRPLDASERLRAVDEQLRALREELARLPKPVAAPEVASLMTTALAPILEKVPRLEAMLGDIRIRVDEQRAREAYTGDDDGGLPARMRRSLAQRGFEIVHVLGDVVEGANDDELRVPVEARRAGMTYKGTVTVADGRVTDIALKPATEIFP